MAKEGKGGKKPKRVRKPVKANAEAQHAEPSMDEVSAQPSSPEIAPSEELSIRAEGVDVYGESIAEYESDEDEASNQNLSDFILFKLAQDAYAVRVSGISEILRQQMITRVPRAAEHVLGVTSLRGLVIPVIDPGVLLKGLRHFGLKDASKIIVLKADQPVGMMVSPELNMVSFDEGALRSKPSHLDERSAELLDGAIEIDGCFIPVLKLENLLSIKATGRLNEREA